MKYKDTFELIERLRGRISYIKHHGSNFPLHQDGDVEMIEEIIKRLEEYNELKKENAELQYKILDGMFNTLKKITK